MSKSVFGSIPRSVLERNTWIMDKTARDAVASNVQISHERDYLQVLLKRHKDKFFGQYVWFKNNGVEHSGKIIRADASTGAILCEVHDGTGRVLTAWPTEIKFRN